MFLLFLQDLHVVCTLLGGCVATTQPHSSAEVVLPSTALGSLALHHMLAEGMSLARRHIAGQVRLVD